MIALDNGVGLRIVGQNLTNAVCYTEGNPRNSVAQNLNEFGYARPNVGRTVTGTISYKF